MLITRVTSELGSPATVFANVVTSASVIKLSVDQTLTLISLFSVRYRFPLTRPTQNSRSNVLCNRPTIPAQ